MKSSTGDGTAAPLERLVELLSNSAKDVDNQEASAGLVDADLRSVIDTVFGGNADRAYRYHSWLAEEATVRGLIGPRETPKLWDRHIINSAVVGEAIGKGLVVADIGSGAGLPGIPLALARPDLKVVLVEPLLRRTTFLNEVVEDLELDNVTVVRARAEEKVVRAEVGQVDVVTSRAVAPLGKLAGWSLPLVKSGGAMVALKGGTAQEEIDRDAKLIAKAKGTNPRVVEVGGSVLGTSTYAVIIQKK
ncbi:16S rRNA (guanine(527)-N(7))-methyltransferase RsmG [Corynebacterium amycolatum]|nr:16S rRNA (guanine(527)-N(7))-methyltransferase RsmG [Corynebacterium amycolatum]